MILDRLSGHNCIFGVRFLKINPLKSLWNFGNFFLNLVFNFINQSKLNDTLCCAKSFFIDDLNLNKIRSKGFDIDVEISKQLIKKHPNIQTVFLSYDRRGIKQGKKVRLYDGWIILKRILRN